jgi:hypothetical protein
LSLLWRKQKLIALKFYWLYPLILLVKVGWRQGRVLRNEEGKMMGKWTGYAAEERS